MTCIKCRAQMLPPCLTDMEGDLKGETVNVQITASECPACGHKSIEGRRMPEFMQKIADAYRVKRKLLTSAEILRARERLGMSQVEFAEYLGVGSASVKRWELGELQTKMVDELIRVKTDPNYAESLVAALYERLTLSSEASRLGGVLAPRAANCELELAA